MTLNEHETKEIRDVAQLLDNLQFNMRQPHYIGDTGQHLVRFRDRLRELLPKHETLENVVEDLLRDSELHKTMNAGRGTTMDAKPYMDRLRAALAAVRGKAGV